MLLSENSIYDAREDSVLFTSKERDAETGLDYFGARYLSSAQGRFTSPDSPLLDQQAEDPQSWNLYSYVRNKPLVYVDPTGQILEISSSSSSTETADITARLQRLAPGTTVSGAGRVSGPGFFRRIANTLTGSGAGTSLVHDLVTSGNTTTIVPIHPGSASSPASSNSAAPAAGGSWNGPSNANAFIDLSSTGVTLPTHTTSTVSASGNPIGSVAMMGRDITVALAHELIHSLHIMDGSVSFAPGVNRFTSGANVYEERYNSEELRTVGFPGSWRIGDVSENYIRQQFGYLPRAAYTGPGSWKKIK